MDKKTIAIIIAVAVVFGGVGFWGGNSYAIGQATATRAARGGGQFGGGTAGGRIGTRGGSFTGGKVIAKDDKSITLQLQDGGSAVVFYSTSTTVMKSATGSISDIAVGTNIIVTGSKNSDGSQTAQSIQIRPDVQAVPAPQQ